MQTDMHYYGTYALARAAGLRPDVCETIATAAQFVDDNAGKESVEFDDGARIDVDATAHHTVDVSNTDREDQRKVWVPFHFLPGNRGQSYTERLPCRKGDESEIAQELVERNVSLAAKPYAVELLGITAHVYADTFSHYGFSGVSSRRNKIVNDSIELDEDLDPQIRTYIVKKAERFKRTYRNEGGFFQSIKSWFAETASGALGHGAALTFPDRPYLKWRFTYEVTEERVERDNPKTFLEGCRALHTMFRSFAELRSDLRSDDGRDFDDIASTVKGIIRRQAPKSGRIAAWQEQTEALFRGGPERIPDYDAQKWHNARRDLRGVEDSRESLEVPVYRFYQAASNHRQYVIRQLLPKHGLVVN